MEAIQPPTPQQLAEILSRWQAKASAADPDDYRSAELLSALLNDLEDHRFPVEAVVLHEWEPWRRPKDTQEAVGRALGQWEELGLCLREMADEAQRLTGRGRSAGVQDCAEAVEGLLSQIERMVRSSLGMEVAQ